MNAVAPRRVRSRLARSAAALVLALGMLLLSGCAGYSARITILPSHQTFDLDLIMADNALGEASQIGQTCDSLGKSGIAVTKTEHDKNTYCEVKVSIPLASKQSFVKHENGRWIFQMTSKSLLTWLDEQSTGFAQQYPNGLKQEEFDDFHMRVDFPGRVVLHSTGSDVEGTSVIWNDAKLMFSDEGLHAESEDDHSWLPIAITAGAFAVLAAIASRVLWVLGRRRGGTTTRSWPPRRVSAWWQRNTQDWMSRRRPGPRDSGDPDGPR